MQKLITAILIVFSSLSIMANGSDDSKTIKEKVNNKDSFSYVIINTDYGDIKIRLYNETPLHKANFLKLVQQGFFDSTLFHRVIPNFMIQGGDPNSIKAKPGQALGSGDVGYRIPAEFNPALIHKRGVLAAARDGNPEKASSGCQFYIVQGKKFTDEELEQISKSRMINWTDEQKAIYKETGGAAFLDMIYTVFGEVVSGMDVVDKIAAEPCDANDRPVKDVRMKKVKVAE
jgi:peptidyl-prolyl cis-trans isomerase B (cyclophilin B)